MSYCRWSCNDYQCDLYVFADAGGGWTIHVAKYKRIFKETLPPAVPLTAETVPQWIERDRAVSAIVERSERVPVGLPHDGKSFNDDRDGTVETLKMLREAGYRFPYEIIDEIASEEENEGET